MHCSIFSQADEEVLALVPPEWPLDVVSSFFQRSIRRQLHDKASGEIVKAISAGQNMEVSHHITTVLTKRHQSGT